MESAWSDALVDGSDCTGLIHGFEVGTKKGECGDFNTEYDGVESEGGLERRRRRRAGAGDVGPSAKVSSVCVK